MAEYEYTCPSCGYSETNSYPRSDAYPKPHDSVTPDGHIVCRDWLKRDYSFGIGSVKGAGGSPGRSS